MWWQLVESVHRFLVVVMVIGGGGDEEGGLGWDEVLEGKEDVLVVEDGLLLEAVLVLLLVVNVGGVLVGGDIDDVDEVEAVEGGVLVVELETVLELL